MATSNIPVLTSAALFVDTDIAGTAVAVKASSAVVYEIEVDNTANGAASYLKLWNTAQGSVTVGTTVPDWVLMIPASVSRTLVMPAGITFGTALTVACTTAGGTTGSTGPTSDVTVRIVYV